MKKYVLISFLLVSSLVLTGCNGQTVTNQQQEKTYDLSQSVWKSTDGGTNWEAKNKTKEKPTITDLDVLSMAINPNDSQNIYVGLKAGGMIKTIDGGETWQFTNVTADNVYGLVIDPINSRTIYLSGLWQKRGKIWKSEDAGENWKEIYTTASEGPFVIAMTMDPINPKNIYASTSDNQVIKTEDAGVSWKNIYEADAPVFRIAVDRSNSQLAYFLTTSNELFSTEDGGNNITDISENFSAVNSSGNDFSVIATDPNKSGAVYIAGTGGMLRSNNSGVDWEKVNTLNNPSNFPITALAINPKNPYEIVYTASQALYKSEDGGIHWTTYQFNTAQYVNIIKYDPNNPSIIYLGFRK